MARLQGATGATSAPARHLGRNPAPMLTVLAQAALEGREGGNLRSVVQILAADPKDRLAVALALARLGRAFMARDSVSFTGLHQVRRNLTDSRNT